MDIEEARRSALKAESDLTKAHETAITIVRDAQEALVDARKALAKAYQEGVWRV